MKNKTVAVILGGLLGLTLIGPEMDRSFASEQYSLSDLYRIALERSERVKMSEEEVLLAETQKNKARSVLLPTVSAFSNYTKYNQSQKFGDLVIQPDWSASWGARIDKSFSLSGRELTAYRSSKDNIERSKYELSATREGYIYQVASAFYDVLRAGRAVEIAEDSVLRLTKHRDEASVRLKQGEVTKTALLRAEAELSGARSELRKTQNNQKLAKAVLSRTVGLTGDLEIKETVPQNHGPDLEVIGGEFVNQATALERLKSHALSQRAEVKALELEEKISRDRVKYAQGAYWPGISIEGGYIGRDDGPSAPFSSKETIYGGISLSMAIFEGGLRKADISESKARERQAKLAVDDFKKTISIEVENAYLDLMTEQEIIQSLEAQLAFAKDNYNAVSRQFEFGLATSIEVMDANTLLLTAERQLADAGYLRDLSLLRVERATGTLLDIAMGSQKGMSARSKAAPGMKMQ